MSDSSIGLRPIKKGVVVDIYDNGEIPLALGKHRLLMINDADLNSPHARNGHTRHKGIRPRWGLVLAVSDEAEERTGIKVGDKVLMEHGEWTPGFPFGPDRKKVWWISHEKIIGVDEDGLNQVEKEFLAARDRS